MRMRREAGHHGLPQLAKVVREAGDLIAGYPGVDKQHAVAALHDDGVGLHELALVGQHTFRDLRQHVGSFRLWSATASPARTRDPATAAPPSGTSSWTNCATRTSA